MNAFSDPVRRLGESRTCRRVARTLPELVERPSVTDLGVHRHLRTCAACQAKLRQYRSLRHLMADLPVGEPEPDRSPSVSVRSGVDVAVGTMAVAAAAMLLGRAVRRRA